MIKYYGGNVISTEIETVRVGSTQVELQRLGKNEWMQELSSYIAQSIHINRVPILDTETTGLSYHRDTVIMIQLGDSETQFIADTRKLDIKELKELLESLKFSGVNIKFDYNMLKRYGIVIDIKEDLYLNEVVLDAGITDMQAGTAFRRKHGFGKFSMAGVVYKYLGESLDKDTTKTFLTIGHKEFTNTHIAYGAQDIIMPYKALPYQHKELQENGYRNKFTVDGHTFDLCTFEAQVSLALGDMEYNGMPIDVDKWLALDKVFVREALASREKLNNIALEAGLLNPDQYGLFGPVVKWTSPKQVITMLSKIRGVDLVDKKTNKVSVGEDVLRQNIEISPIFAELINYRKLSKSVSTYGKNFVKKHVYNGRLYTTYNQIVSTGRTSSRKPNLQNIPSLPEVRECFCVPSTHKLINCDYDSQEKRITTSKSEEPILVDFFLNGDGDAHSLFANKMFEVIEGVPQNVTSENPGWYEPLGESKRKIGKFTGFKLDYGGSASTIATSFDIELEEAKVIYNAAVDAYPVQKEYFRKVSRDSIAQGYILMNNVTHRKRKLPNFDLYKDRWNAIQDKIGYDGVAYLYNCLMDDKDIEFKRYGKINRKTLMSFVKMTSLYKRLSMNTPTQGTAGDMTKLALVLLRLKLIKDGHKPLSTADIKLVVQVHDETITQCLNRLKKYTFDAVKYSMELSGKTFCKAVPVTATPVESQIWEH